MGSATPSALAARLPVPPLGYSRYRNRLNFFDFLYPETWFQITGAGDTTVFRAAANPEESLFVDISSPTASKYNELGDYGDLASATAQLKDQLQVELMSTRLGVQREAEVISAVERVGQYDGAKYYDIQIRMRSYAGSNELATYPEQRNIYMEWDRDYITTLGVANKRLYALRLVTPHKDLETEKETLKVIYESFRCYEDPGN
jgi:hypothetical protein